MLVSVVQIGNSRGVRLPKAILDQLEISDKVEMEVENSQIVLKPVPHQPRQGWDKAFNRMKERGEDELLLADEAATRDFEWEW
jgi:antitoxin MazE